MAGVFIWRTHDSKPYPGEKEVVLPSSSIIDNALETHNIDDVVREYFNQFGLPFPSLEPFQFSMMPNDNYISLMNNSQEADCLSDLNQVRYEKANCLNQVRELSEKASRDIHQLQDELASKKGENYALNFQYNQVRELYEKASQEIHQLQGELRQATLNELQVPPSDTAPNPLPSKPAPTFLQGILDGKKLKPAQKTPPTVLDGARNPPPTFLQGILDGKKLNPARIRKLKPARKPPPSIMQGILDGKKLKPARIRKPNRQPQGNDRKTASGKCRADKGYTALEEEKCGKYKRGDCINKDERFYCGLEDLNADINGEEDDTNDWSDQDEDEFD